MALGLPRTVLLSVFHNESNKLDLANLLHACRSTNAHLFDTEERTREQARIAEAEEKEHPITSDRLEERQRFAAQEHVNFLTERRSQLAGACGNFCKDVLKLVVGTSRYETHVEETHVHEIHIESRWILDRDSCHGGEVPIAR